MTLNPGTTGYPKPAIYTHGANLWAGGLGIMMKWGPEDTLFTGCPLFHTLGKKIIFLITVIVEYL